jgi:hypothetical protein
MKLEMVNMRVFQYILRIFTISDPEYEPWTEVGSCVKTKTGCIQMRKRNCSSSQEGVILKPLKP